MQDVEFTIERKKLWMLQTRNGKRTARAAIKMAVDMAKEGLITKKKPSSRVTPEQVDMLLHPQFSAEIKKKARKDGRLLVSKAVNASPGAAVGMAVFDADTAAEWGKSRQGRHHGPPRNQARRCPRHDRRQGHSHQPRWRHQPCRRGRPPVRHARRLRRRRAGNQRRAAPLQRPRWTTSIIEVHEGDWISIDGGTGEVFLGQLPTQDPDFEHEVELNTLLRWADEVRTLGVWANADYPKDAERARRYGAEGIGLCRTEHMFFEEERLPIVQEMIMATSKARRLSALDRLLPMQRGDFEGIFRAMDGQPVIIRLLDPPLHEFLPSYQDLVPDLADLKVRLQHFHTLSEIDTALAAGAPEGRHPRAASRR